MKLSTENSKPSGWGERLGSRGRLSSASIDPKRSRRFGVIGVRKLAVPVGEGFFVDVAYETKGRFFALADKTHENWVSLKIGWVRGDISYGDSGNVEEFSTRLARGLFHLDLLTPEVEYKLTATISAHQKMEWAGEYQQRYRYGL